MIQFANAKINIGLHILQKRQDGYHNLETVFYPIPLYDVVEIVESTNTRMEYSGQGIPGNQSDNLCLHAYRLLQRDFDLPSVTIYLHKTIPVGAGLGGGSSDAVATLTGLNLRFQLGLPSASLEGYARRLGSDCAFFVRNRPSFASGTGDQLEEIDLNLKGYRLLLVKPDIHISTVDAYRMIRPQQPKIALRKAIERPLGEWRTIISNDFEVALFEEYPLLHTLKSTLYEEGALYASMSGSGSAVYGIFPDRLPPSAIGSLQQLVGEEGVFELEFPG